MKIVLGTDLSVEALAAARWAFDYARILGGQKLDVSLDIVHVVSPPERRLDAGHAAIDEPDYRHRLNVMVDEWLGKHVDRNIAHEIYFREGSAVVELEGWARKAGADLLVVGMSGMGTFARMMVGSTAHKLAQRPPTRLALVHRDRPILASKPRLMAAVDLLETSDEVLRAAASTARQLGGTLDVVYVIMPPRPIGLPNGLVGMAMSGPEMAEMERDAGRELEDWLAARVELVEGLEVRHTVLTGFPTRQLVEYAEENAVAALVIGTVSRSALDHFMLGSVASGIVRHMPCTVILTPPTKV